MAMVHFFLLLLLSPPDFIFHRTKESHTVWTGVVSHGPRNAALLKERHGHMPMARGEWVGWVSVLVWHGMVDVMLATTTIEHRRMLPPNACAVDKVNLFRIFSLISLTEAIFYCVLFPFTRIRLTSSVGNGVYLVIQFHYFYLALILYHDGVGSFAFFFSSALLPLWSPPIVSGRLRFSVLVCVRPLLLSIPEMSRDIHEPKKRKKRRENNNRKYD